MGIKTIICDDNEKARYILCEYIKRLGMDEIEIIGQATGGFNLIDMCNHLSPDLILLDIDMPLINGIQAAKEILSFLPDVNFIFITAYPSYSIESFEVHPFDYILKPVIIERLGVSLEKFIQKFPKKQDAEVNQLVSFISNYNDYSIPQNDILFIERTGRKLLIHTVNEQIELNSSLKNFECKLNPKIFIRAHNSYLINIQAVSKIKKGIGKSYEVQFKNYDKIAYINKKNLIKLESITDTSIY